MPSLHPLLQPYCHNDLNCPQALQLLHLQQSDLIFVNNFGLRLLHRPVLQQILLLDRYPQASQFAPSNIASMAACVAQLLATGYGLVQCRPFQFTTAHWAGFLTHSQQVTSQPPRTHYRCPLMPLLKISNLTLPDRLKCGLRSIVEAQLAAQVTTLAQGTPARAAVA